MSESLQLQVESGILKVNYGLKLYLIEILRTYENRCIVKEKN